MVGSAVGVVLLELVEVEEVEGFGGDVKVVLEVVGAGTLLLVEPEVEVALMLDMLDVEVGGGGAVDGGGPEEVECSDVLVDVDLEVFIVLGSVTVSVFVVSVVVVGSSGGEILCVGRMIEILELRSMLLVSASESVDVLLEDTVISDRVVASVRELEEAEDSLAVPEGICRILELLLPLSIDELTVLDDSALKVMADALEEVREVSSPMLVVARLRDIDVEVLSSTVADERISLSGEEPLPVSRPLDSGESNSAVEDPDARVAELCVLARADRELVRSETLLRVSVSD